MEPGDVLFQAVIKQQDGCGGESCCAVKSMNNEGGRLKRSPSSLLFVFYLLEINIGDFIIPRPLGALLLFLPGVGLTLLRAALL